MLSVLRHLISLLLLADPNLEVVAQYPQVCMPACASMTAAARSSTDQADAGPLQEYLPNAGALDMHMCKATMQPAPWRLAFSPLTQLCASLFCRTRRVTTTWTETTRSWTRMAPRCTCPPTPSSPPTSSCRSPPSPPMWRHTQSVRESLAIARNMSHPATHAHLCRLMQLATGQLHAVLAARHIHEQICQTSAVAHTTQHHVLTCLHVLIRSKPAFKQQRHHTTGEHRWPRHRACLGLRHHQAPVRSMCVTYLGSSRG